MLTIIIYTVALSLITLFFVKYMSDDWGEAITGAVVNFFIGALLGTVIACCVSPNYKICVTKYNVVTLQDNPSLKGRFYLFGGVIDGNMKYTYYVQDGAQYKMLMTDYNKAIIKNTKLHPVSEHYVAKRCDSYWSIGGIDNIEVMVIFRVPEGTIGNEYTLDAK